jgi:hypothetical protein
VHARIHSCCAPFTWNCVSACAHPFVLRAVHLELWETHLSELLRSVMKYQIVKFVAAAMTSLL